MVMKRKLPSTLSKESGQSNTATQGGGSSHAVDSAMSATSQPSSASMVDPTRQAHKNASKNPRDSVPQAPAAPASTAEPVVTAPVAPEFDMPSFNDFATAGSNDSAADLSWASEPVAEPQAPSEPATSAPSVPPVAQTASAPVAPETAYSHTGSAPIAPESSAPQQNSDAGWQIDDLLQAAPTDSDIFGNAYGSVPNEGVSAPGQSPFDQGNTAPVELPGDKPKAFSHDSIASENTSGNNNGAIAGIAIVVVVVLASVVGYKFLSGNDQLAERVNRWSGSMKDVSESLPETVEEGFVTRGKAQSVLQPESVVVIGDSKDSEGVNEADSEIEISLEEASAKDDLFEGDIPESINEVPEKMVVAQVESSTESSSEEGAGTVIEFVDVDAEEVDKPIDGADEEMPDDVGVIVQLQRAIDKARKDKNPEDFKNAEKELEKVAAGSDKKAIAEGEAAELSEGEKRDRNKELAKQLELDLASYRKALAGEPGRSATIVDPKTYFKAKRSGQEVSAEDKPALLPKVAPVVVGRSADVDSQEEAQNRYGANPQGLPYVSQPGQPTAPKVRTLEDYGVTMFNPEREKVRIPKHVKPAFNASAFPQITVLSLVSGRGIIAETPASRGVLMIGETLEGWELVDVTEGYATFHKNNIKHTVTLGQ